MNDTPLSPPVKGVGKIIHIAGWAILFCSPFFFTGTEVAISLEDYLHSIVVPLSFMLVFYVNYCWLVKEYLFSRRSGRFVLMNVLLIAGVMFIVHMTMRYLFPEIEPQAEPNFQPGPNFQPDPNLQPDPNFRPDPNTQQPGPNPPRGGGIPPQRLRPINQTIAFFLINAGIYSLVAGLSVAIKMTYGWYRVERLQREMEKERAEAELQNLKSQLNPHFLFNTLNNIYSLIAFSPEKAQEAVHDLSRLLRYVLYESSRPLVPLEKDLDFLRNYVELMRIRLPNHVRLDTSITVSSPGILIAPLLFISLVENAFKHGVSNSKPSFIQMSIHQEGTQVVCSILNSYFPKTPEQDKSGSGIGLVNLRKRLSLLYPEHYEFRCEREGDNYRSYLSITINDAEV